MIVVRVRLAVHSIARSGPDAMTAQRPERRRTRIRGCLELGRASLAIRFASEIEPQLAIPMNVRVPATSPEVDLADRAAGGEDVARRVQARAGFREHLDEVVAAPARQHPDARRPSPSQRSIGDRADQPVATERDRGLARGRRGSARELAGVLEAARQLDVVGDSILVRTSASCRTPSEGPARAAHPPAEGLAISERPPLHGDASPQPGPLLQAHLAGTERAGPRRRQSVQGRRRPRPARLPGSA